MQEPQPSDWLAGLAASGLHLNAGLPDALGSVLVAVKPQTMAAALPALARLGGGATLFVTVAAGTRIAAYEAALGPEPRWCGRCPTPRPRRPGITALVGNPAAGEAGLATAEALMSAVGQTLRLPDESLMDAVTAVSGSGPAYVFHLIETLAAAGAAEGLPPDLALTLARATVAGAGHLAQVSGEDPGVLRRNVTSPGGTTAAALAHLMDPESGFPALMRRAVHAAAVRGRELGQ